MKDVKKTIKNLLSDESGQGTTEYILVLFVVVALALLFKNQIMSIVEQKVGDISSKIQEFK